MSLRVESVSKKYHQKKALDNISITFDDLWALRQKRGW